MGFLSGLFRRKAKSPLDDARAASAELRRESRDGRRARKRGDGDHFGKTPIKKYGDEHHADGGFGSGGGGGGSGD